MRAAFALGLTMLCMCSSGVAHAKAQVEKGRAPRVFTTQKRDEIAITAVQRALAGWTQPGTTVNVRAAMVPFNGDSRNPITGLGPVEIFVDQMAPARSGFLGRLRARFDASAKQRFLVHVAADGSSQILERTSLAPQRRFARFLVDKLQLPGLFADFYRSKQAGEGLWTAVGAGSAIALSPALSGALFMRLAQVVRDGLASQSAVRNQALDSAVAWAKASQKSSRQWPTLMETYRAYTDTIDAIEHGVRPLELGRFAEALSIRQL